MKEVPKTGLYFISGGAIYFYPPSASAAAGPGGPVPIYKPETDKFLFKQLQINSLLASPDRNSFALVVQNGAVQKDDRFSYFLGNLKLTIIDSKGVWHQEYLIANNQKAVSLVYFWKDSAVWAKINFVGDKGDASPLYMLLPTSGRIAILPLAADQYEQAVRSEKLEMIFTDFHAPAFRVSNQALGGDPVSLDRDAIVRVRGANREVLLNAGQFFKDSKGLFNSFQLSPDQKKIAFNKDSSGCELNELYVYDLESKRQQQVASGTAPLNFAWAGAGILAYDTGSGAGQRVRLFSTASGESAPALEKDETQGLFFLNDTFVCEKGKTGAIIKKKF